MSGGIEVEVVEHHFVSVPHLGAPTLSTLTHDAACCRHNLSYHLPPQATGNKMDEEE